MNRTTEYLPNANGEFLVDENAGFYYAQPQGNAHVFVEKYAVKKIDFTPGEVGMSATSKSGYLVKETNFSDIGGGLMTFNRHYAVLPDPWDGYEIVSYTQQGRVRLGVEEWQIVVNPEARPSGMFSFITYSNTVSRLAKATRSYYLESGFNDETIDFGLTGYVDPSGAIKVRPDSFRVYMAGMFEVTSYTVTY